MLCFVALFALLSSADITEDASQAGSLIQRRKAANKVQVDIQQEHESACVDYVPRDGGLWRDDYGDPCDGQYMSYGGGRCMGYDAYPYGPARRSWGSGTDGLFQDEACCDCKGADGTYGGQAKADSLACSCNGHGTTSGWSFNGCNAACACEAGFTGTRCETQTVFPCEAQADCSSHGSTTDGDKSDGCTCICRQNWEGADCSTKSLCTDNSVCNNGVVGGNHVDGCECTCNEGWGGEFCDQPTPCDATQHCSGHGTTVDTTMHDGCDCQCDPKWTGEACHLKKTCQDANLHCNGHGTVSGNWVDGCQCDCTGGWSGPNCRVPPACAASDCSNHGTTSDLDNTDGCACSCESSWDGEDCSQQKVCPNDYCNNRGTVGGNLVDGCTCSDCQQNVPERANSARFAGDQCQNPPVCPNLNGIPAKRQASVIWMNRNHLNHFPGDAGKINWYTGIPGTWWHGWVEDQAKTELLNCLDEQCPNLHGHGKQGWIDAVNNNVAAGKAFYQDLPGTWWHGSPKGFLLEHVGYC